MAEACQPICRGWFTWGWSTAEACRSQSCSDICLSAANWTKWRTGDEAGGKDVESFRQTSIEHLAVVPLRCDARCSISRAFDNERIDGNTRGFRGLVFKPQPT